MQDPIYIKHPLEECNISQANFLSEVNSPKLLTEHIYLFNYGNATYQYHNQVQSQELTLELHETWLSGLQEPMRSDFSKQGFENNKTNLSFTRFVMEMADVGMDEFILNLLNDEHKRRFIEIRENTKEE